ncbi:MAG: SAM-dependent methyltransferase [Planctomycetota bacterium]|jgi:SAM-dependent methyltransferase
MTPVNESSRPLWRQGLDRLRRWQSARTLSISDDPEPTLERPVSQAATASQCDDPIYIRWCDVIREEPKLHRKQWEFVYVLQALEVRGMLAEGRRGLGFGVGREPLVAALAARGCALLATDLEPDNPAVENWRASGEYGGAKGTLNGRGICPPDTFDANVEFAFADMRDPSTIPGSFDFLWSSCALEHLGSLAAGFDFLRASLALLRPGGVAVHTTEYNVSSDAETVEDGPVVLYRRRDLLQLRDELRALGYELELNFNTGSTPSDLHIDIWPYDSPRHLKMLHTRFATTSIGLTITRASPS